MNELNIEDALPTSTNGLCYSCGGELMIVGEGGQGVVCKCESCGEVQQKEE